jgi:hypothetical protein
LSVVTRIPSWFVLTRQTEDAIALWEQRVEDYVAYVNGE